MATREEDLEVVSQAIHLFHQEVDVGGTDSGIGDDIPEEVGSVADGLVGDH